MGPFNSSKIITDQSPIGISSPGRIAPSAKPILSELFENCRCTPMGSRSHLKFSLAEARRIALSAQGFGQERPLHLITPRHLRKVWDRLGQLQIDSVNILARAHYVPLFTRLGPYPTPLLDEASYLPGKRRLFEYWGHEASLIPIQHFPLFNWRMLSAQNLVGGWAGVTSIARSRPKLVERVLECVTSHGPAGASEIEKMAETSKKNRPVGWWEWSDCKRALEWLFWCGKITTASRRHFERIYDLTERVIPSSIYKAPKPATEEAQRQLILIASRALGIGTESDLLDYFRLNPANCRARIAELTEDQRLMPATVAGKVAFFHPEARIPRKVEACALVSPFDPLVWKRERLERYFEFRYRIEIYTPAHKRSHGYYVLPFLLGDRFVARLDLKADRKSSALHVIAAHGELDINEMQVASALSGELGLMARWLGLERIEVGTLGNLANLLRETGQERRNHLNIS
jgi:uncharacterized protein